MRLILSIILLFLLPLSGKALDYWAIDPNNEAIVWEVNENLPHSDHLEMAGKQTACVIRYGVNEDKSFKIEKSLIWPTLRMVPNNTHASLMRKISLDLPHHILINEKPVKETVNTITFDGLLNIKSNLGKDVKLTRRYLPASTGKALIENYSLINEGHQSVSIEIPDINTVLSTPEERGVDGVYLVEGTTIGSGDYKLAPGESLDFSYVISARRNSEEKEKFDPSAEEASRREAVANWCSSLELDTPVDILNRMFDFSKIRACESIYETKGGPMHGPGGESYYAAIWANDQAEYANPLFPFTGYDYANESAVNSFRWFGEYMNPEYKPIPSSIIAEGDSYWNGAGDRGDAAMIAYGVGRFCLAKGDKATAQKLWPLMEWCLEYCKRNLNDDGVVASDSDELENRFPSGEANLCTSSLYYDALLSASYLCKELGLPARKQKEYEKEAQQLRKGIDSYFDGPVEGYETYAYYKGNDLLRSWICIPLTVGIYEKAPATIDALFSDKLWSDNGLLTQSGDKTFWDRSTLYALRGILQAGYIDEALPHLLSYSQKRLIGEHVPYAIEAWPEGNQRQLSAESALYARIFTEGLFGIRPTGFKSMALTPRLPKEWPSMSLRNIKAFGENFDIVVEADGDKNTKVKILKGNKPHIEKRIKRGETLNVRL